MQVKYRNGREAQTEIPSKVFKGRHNWGSLHIKAPIQTEGFRRSAQRSTASSSENRGAASQAPSPLAFLQAAKQPEARRGIC